MYSVIRNVCLGMIFGLGLVACGDDDKAAMSAPASSAAPAAMPASGGEKATSSMKIEKAEGVIYQDEIYANWPYN